MSNRFPFKSEPDFHDALWLGGAAIFHGVLVLFGVLSTLYSFTHQHAWERNRILLLLTILHMFVFLGLIFIGVLIFFRFRFLLLLFLPLSIIGLIAFPFGTLFYVFYIKEFWVFRKLFFPFDRKKVRIPPDSTT